MLLLHLLCVAPLVFAQYGGGSGATSSTGTAPTATSGASSSTPTITVGQNGLTFNPSSVVVAPGHSVVFQFYPGNHSVVQGSFDTPCQPLSGTGFYSGFVDSSSGPASQVFTVPVNSSDPFWFYCGQTSHCQSGMVGVINPPSSGQTLAQYHSSAASSNSSSSPAKVQGGTLAAPSSPSPSSSKSTGHRELELTGGFFSALSMVVLALAM